VSWLLASGHIFDIVIAVLVIEGITLALYHRRTGRGVAPADLAGTLIAGLGLVLAARLAITGWSYEWVGAALLLGFAGHLGDVARRWRG